VAPQKKVVVTRTESPDFSKAMETLKRVRAKSDELDERISRLTANLA
jgi:BMFP domain-containing protein YqiC